jgi:outer membrane phospholipase A
MHYSIKYSFCGERLGASAQPVQSRKDPEGIQFCSALHFPEQWEFFVAYTGEFDFYAGTRDSGPVINRLSMPGLYLRIPYRLPGLNRSDADSIELGVQHRSNGQVTEIAQARDIERVQLAYDQASADASQRHYFDGISRGANFFSLALDKRGRWDTLNLELSLRAKVKIYWGKQDSAITWGPLADQGRRFSDYDRLTLIGSASWREFTANLEWRLGDLGLRTDSFTLGLQWDLGGVPLYLRAHRGPMNTLSNYAQRQDSVGLGLRFARY